MSVHAPHALCTLTPSHLTAVPQFNGGVASRGQITETLRRTKEIRYYLFQVLFGAPYLLGIHFLGWKTFGFPVMQVSRQNGTLSPCKNL